LPNFIKTKHATEGENKEQKERTHVYAWKKAIVVVIKDGEGEHMVEFFIYGKWTLHTSS
jgi:hypothetical protein